MVVSAKQAAGAAAAAASVAALAYGGRKLYDAHCGVKTYETDFDNEGVSCRVSLRTSGQPGDALCRRPPPELKEKKYCPSLPYSSEAGYHRSLLNAVRTSANKMQGELGFQFCVGKLAGSAGVAPTLFVGGSGRERSDTDGASWRPAAASEAVDFTCTTRGKGPFLVKARVDYPVQLQLRACVIDTSLILEVFEPSVASSTLRLGPAKKLKDYYPSLLQDAASFLRKHDLQLKGAEKGACAAAVKSKELELVSRATRFKHIEREVEKKVGILKQFRQCLSRFAATSGCNSVVFGAVEGEGLSSPRMCYSSLPGEVEDNSDFLVTPSDEALLAATLSAGSISGVLVWMDVQPSQGAVVVKGACPCRWAGWDKASDGDLWQDAAKISDVFALHERAAVGMFPATAKAARKVLDLPRAIKRVVRETTRRLA